MKIGKIFFILVFTIISMPQIFAQTKIDVCKAKIENQLFSVMPTIKLIKGYSYQVTFFGQYADYLFNGPSISKGILTLTFGEDRSFTLNPCDTYQTISIAVNNGAPVSNNVKLELSGKMPVTGEIVYTNFIADIVDIPSVTSIKFKEPGASDYTTRIVAGKQYTMELTGNGLDNLSLLSADGITVGNQSKTSTALTSALKCNVSFEYSQPTNVNSLKALLLPCYGYEPPVSNKYVRGINVPVFGVLPRPTVFSNNNIDWSWGPYYGERGTFFADVTGDRKADAIVINNSNVFVRRSDGTAFQPNESWTTNPYYGERGTFFSDVTGDGMADAIVVNNSNIVVRRSNGNRFTDNESWTSNAYYGERGTFFADVTGDGKADAIVVNNANIVVRPSIGNSFGEQQIWTTGAFYGERSTHFADVDGDGKADVIAVNNAGIVIKKSVGNRFGPNESFTANPYYGTRGTYFVDVTGDRKADAIVINDDKITVRRSTGTAFSPNEDGTNLAFYGQRGTAFADVYGDGKAAAIVVNDAAVYVRRAN